MNGQVVGLTKAGTVATLLTEKERNLIAAIRKVPFGTVEVSMLEGQPDRIIRVRESIKL